MVVPNSTIILIKSPIELDSTNQLTFSTKEAQETYFKSLPHLQYDNATYQRKEGVIRFPTSPTGVTYEDLLEYNYCMYQNTNYDSKWFYAYITNITYDNDGMSLIEIETDVFQSWQFDIVYKPSFIEREMLSKTDDVIGANTIPENLETGEYVNIDKTSFSYGGYYTCIAVSENLFDTTDSRVQMYNGIASGLTYIILKTSDDIQKAIWLYDGKADALYSMFMIPQNFVSSPSWRQWTFSFGGINVTIDYAYVQSTTLPFVVNTTTLSINTKIGNANGYTPKNNKLFTYPYNYIRADNNAGTNVIYQYELFANKNSIVFQTGGNICTGCSIKTIPKDYKNISTNYSESINGAKLPVCGWVNDPYTNWLTQNSVNMEANIVKSTFGGAIGAGAMSGNLLGGLAGASLGGIKAIYDNIVARESHDLIPLQANGNTNSSDIMFSFNEIAISFYRVSIKEEFARVIDDFFSMYGYKTNRLKLPNINNRSNWNYVKTIGCNLIGDIPQRDLQKIKDLFNNGITLWHNSSTFLDYSQANN